ncbi:hypothetical protein [Sorangium cellulosum]|uniref:hypothetical protein n=1 Tax=Sorangium cellulosum TaxID=56 RepID=UPI0013318FF4|nr:hypothetical protein [Sorangium cellulosum]
MLQHARLTADDHELDAEAVQDLEREVLLLMAKAFSTLAQAPASPRASAKEAALAAPRASAARFVPSSPPAGCVPG